jgi:integrase
VSKPNDGYVFQRGSKWVARVTFTDPASGKRREQWKTGRNEQHARELLAGMLASLESTKIATANPSANTGPLFKEIAAQYSAHKVKPAQYRNDRKVAGMRSVRTVRLRISVLVDYFGDTPVAMITPARIERFKLERLEKPTKNKTERSIASVNRELEVLRAILRFARNEGIIPASPFERASTPIISKADETKRTRVLSPNEETRLLEACKKPTRAHLYPIVVAALDTGARKGELLALRWSDINALERRITLRAMTTKTMQTRIVPLSGRFVVALYQMYGKVEKGKDRGGLPVNDDLVFNLKKFQNGWDAACEDAKIDDLRFHDLRATFATRLIARGMPLEEVSKITGHTQLSTLYAHYIRNTSDAVSRATRLLDGDDDDDEYDE